MTDTDMLYMSSLEKRNEELEAKVAELEGKHFVECDRLIKEKGELLSKVSGGDVLRICQLEEQLEKAKRLLKAAVEDMYNSVNDTHCKYCSKWHTDQCQGTSHLDCYLENKFKWRHADEALALIGEDGEQNG